MKIVFPVMANISLNSRVHWSVKSKRAREQRQIVGWILKGRQRPEPPFVIRLTRVGPKRMDDDNAIGSLKACRDAIAEWIGIDDGILTWAYSQRTGPYMVEMEIE